MKLSLAEERSLLENVSGSPDPRLRKRSRDKLVLANMGLVEYWAKRFRVATLDTADLIQEGTLGLMTAIDRFDLSYEGRLAGYANDWIRKAMLQAIEASKAVRVPTNIGSQARRVSRAEARGEALPTAKELGVTASTHERIVEYRRFAAVSIDAPINEGSSLHEVLGTEAPEMLNECDAALLLATLDDRELAMVRAHFGFGTDDEPTLEQVGAEHGVSRERARQVIEAAIGKLRKRARGSRA